ncbi:hypothetical protein FSHL1_005121 [Fusarium sambucinum]
MPTATEFFGFSAHNLGPLTTTYTAPSSCSTGTDRLAFVNASDPVRAYGIPTCDVKPLGDCLPSGSSWESVEGQTTEFVQGLYAYYSPGLVCPSGWRTVGSLAHDSDDDEKALASGALATPKWDDQPGLRILHATEFWLGILEPSETLAYCCPSDYQADAFGLCISTLGPIESYTYSKMCITIGNDFVPIKTWDGTTLTDHELVSMASGTEEPWTTLDDRLLTVTEVKEHLAIATYVPAVPLVYKKSDLEKEDDDNDSNDDDDDEDGNNDDDGNDDDNAASAATSLQGAVSALAMTLGLLAGAGMLL